LLDVGLLDAVLLDMVLPDGGLTVGSPFPPSALVWSLGLESGGRR
jgi:hypothetical protein